MFTKPAQINVPNVDRDSIHILPLSILPLKTPGLKHARLIRNVRLESVVELFDDTMSGSGQMDISALDSTFGWSPNEPHPDRTILRKMAALPSFDVYSLRILLREAGITVNFIDALTLSPMKQRELTKYMIKFTRPLIREIYGAKKLDIESFNDVLALFRDPDEIKARTRLEILAVKLKLQLSEVPRFLEDYGDVFLSLSYYRQCLEELKDLTFGLVSSFGIRHSSLPTIGRVAP